MFTKSKMALAVAIVLGTGVAALAADQTDERGGYVLPGSMDGVNPVYHSELFGSTAFGRVSKPTIHHDRSTVGKPGNSR